MADNSNYDITFALTCIIVDNFQMKKNVWSNPGSNSWLQIGELNSFF